MHTYHTIHTIPYHTIRLVHYGIPYIHTYIWTVPIHMHIYMVYIYIWYVWYGMYGMYGMVCMVSMHKGIKGGFNTDLVGGNHALQDSMKKQILRESENLRIRRIRESENLVVSVESEYQRL